MYDKCVELLSSRGVELIDIAECVMYLQAKYHPEITIDQVIEAVKIVLKKREVQNAILVGVEMDRLAETNSLKDKELNEILVNDHSLFGIDEVIGFGICNLYGSIALSNFGYIDRVKPGIIGRLNSHDGDGLCHTFMDDIVGAIAAAAASRIAHNV